MPWKYWDTKQFDVASGALRIRFQYENDTDVSNSIGIELLDISDIEIPLRTVDNTKYRFGSVKLKWKYDTDLGNMISEIETDNMETSVIVIFYVGTNELWRGLLDFEELKRGGYFYRSGSFELSSIEMKVVDCLSYFKRHSSLLLDYANLGEVSGGAVNQFFENMAAKVGLSAIIQYNSGTDYIDSADNNIQIGDFTIMDSNMTGWDWSGVTVMEFIRAFMMGLGYNIYNLNGHIYIIPVDGDNTDIIDNTDILKIRGYQKVKFDKIKLYYNEIYIPSGNGDFDLIYGTESYDDFRNLSLDIQRHISRFDIGSSSWNSDTVIVSGNLSSTDGFGNGLYTYFDRDSNDGGIGAFLTDADVTFGYIRDTTVDFIAGGVKVGDRLVTQGESQSIYAVKQNELWVFGMSEAVSWSDGDWYEVRKGDSGAGYTYVAQHKIWELIQQAWDRYNNCFLGGEKDSFEIELNSLSSHTDLSVRKVFNSKEYRITNAKFNILTDRAKLEITELN